MEKLTKAIDNFQVWLMTWLRWNAAILMVMIATEVIMRYGIHRPTIWSLDIQTMISGVGRIAPVGYTLMLRNHAVMDIFTHNLTVKRQKFLEMVSYLFFFFPLIGSLAWTTYFRCLRSWKFKETLYTPWRPIVYPMVTGIVIFYTVLFITGINEFIKTTISFQKGSEEWLKDR
ncbi:MAG: TRAP transporter small permease subunit [Chloroflexota bacterium]